MTRARVKRGWAVVTGASAGLGSEFARQLAARGHDIVLTARRRDRLEALAKELHAAHGVETKVIEADLGADSGAQHVLSALAEASIVPEVLVNNAGFGVHGAAIDQPHDRQLEMIRLNVGALTELTLAVGKQMAARGSGSILNIASTGGFQPSPWFAAYAATKAYVVSFSQAIAYELAPRGVHVMVHCPGPTKTEFFQAGGVHVDVADALFMSAERCVAIAIRGMERRKRVVISGALNWLSAWLGRVSPQWMVVRVAAMLMRPHAALPAPKS
jgi:short-subunit dehydrogenase